MLNRTLGVTKITKNHPVSHYNSIGGLAEPDPV